MCIGGAIPPPTSDCYVMIPPADPKLSPAAPILSPAPPLPKTVSVARLICSYYSIFFILFALLVLDMTTVPDCHPDITVESLSPSSPSSAAAVAWHVGFSISDTTKYENLTMEATLFRGNVPVSSPTTLGPFVLGAATTAATFSVPNATALHARHLTPCMAVANLTAKLEFEERVALIKYSKRLMIVCENVVVLLSSNSNRSSCYSSSPPALLDRASCRNDSTDLQDTLGFTGICEMDCWPPRGPVSDVIDVSLFDELLKNRNDPQCEKPGFFTYDAFVTAASFYPDFGSYGSADTRRREIAAFLAQTSIATAGGWDTTPDDHYSWGYCFVTDQNKTDGSCCNENDIEWPCVSGKSYCGRGPIQLTGNSNYGPCGRDIGYNLLHDPEEVANNAVLSFKSALWFWMTPQDPKPSCHDAITGKWTPTQPDINANRLPGFGITTNIINGANECGNATHIQEVDRIGFYEKYCGALSVTYGDNINCDKQTPYDSGVGLIQDI